MSKYLFGYILIWLNTQLSIDIGGYVW